ncbi:MAG TPA: cytochrome C oxidase subunit IV family protein [Planctomycetaceae bacterium]|nr:cytochrome C oxidase subunit IV family protein [Planctomycetaceae bacterium]
MSHDTHAGHDAHDTHHVNYLAIFLILCFCTALSVIFDVMKLDKPVLIVFVLSVAIAKASCVMMFFMHLKFEGNWKFVLLAPTTILAIGLPLALFPDVGASYYHPTAPQVTTWSEEISEYDKYHAEHAEATAHAEPTTEVEPAPAK